MTTYLSPHVTLEEMILSQTASRLGIDNTPTPEIISNLTQTANLIEQVRSLLGDLPIIISSGYRSLALNSAVGGVPSSAHTQGMAADILCPNYGNPYSVCKAIEASTIDFDQLIYEFAAWTHIAWAPNNRRQILTIDSNGSRFGI